MKQIFITAIAAIVIFTSCKKSNDTYRALSSYTVVNATTDVTNARAYAADHEIFWRTLPATDAAAQYKQGNFGAYAGGNVIRAVSGADTTVKLFTGSKAEDFEQGKITNLFLTGNITAGYEGVLVVNETLTNYTDSVFGVRFINLSPNSTPLNITLSTTPATNEASALAYKQITGFKTYPALQSTAAMIFQIRDAADVILATYTLPFAGSGTYATAGIANARFKNITLVIKGLQGTTGGTNALGIFPVAHY